MPLLYILAIVTVWCGISAIAYGIVGFLQTRSNEQKTVKIVFAPEGIEFLLASYFSIALKHGPNSDEAQRFKYGLENNNVLGKEENQRSLVHFLEVTRIFDKSLLDAKQFEEISVAWTGGSGPYSPPKPKKGKKE